MILSFSAAADTMDPIPSPAGEEATPSDKDRLEL